jgi:hypothetical protein
MKHKAALFLLLLGLLTMAGDLMHIDLLKGIGAATTASPAPRVFSAVQGYETYSTRFFLEWKDLEGRQHSLELTPEVYSRIRGPYNRRNVFGAALAYGPVLSTDDTTREMFLAASRYAFTGKAPLLRELGIDPSGVDGPLGLRFVPLPDSDIGDLPTWIEVEAP